MANRSILRSCGASLTVLIALGLGGCQDPAASPLAPGDALLGRHAASAPLLLTFHKTSVAEGVWEGTVWHGNVAGDLRTELTALRVAGPIWHVRFDWIIDVAGRSLVADLSGILNTNTGKVVMNGVVDRGDLAGARVHEEGQLIDIQFDDQGNIVSTTFQGSIRIMQATASRGRP
jgi:hypothetical protein